MAFHLRDAHLVWLSHACRSNLDRRVDLAAGRLATAPPALALQRLPGSSTIVARAPSDRRETGSCPHRPGAEPGTAADKGPSPGRLRRHSFEQPDGAGPNVSEYDASTTPLLAHAVLPPGASTADDSERPNTPPRSRMPTYVRSARSVKALPLVQ